MASLRVSNNASQGFGTTANCVLTGVVAGDLIAVALRDRDGNVPSSVTSSLDGGLTQRVQRGNGVSEGAYIYSLVASTSGDHTITVTYGGNSVFQFYADAFDIDAGTGALDTTANAGNASGTSHGCGVPSTTAASVIYTCSAYSAAHGGATEATGFTIGTAQSAMTRQYKISTGSESPSTTQTTTNSVTSNGVTANFLTGGGGGGGGGISLAWIRA